MEASTAPPSQTSEVTVQLTAEEDQMLQALAHERQLPPEVVLREALAEKKFFADQRRSGKEVVLQDKDKKLIPVVWAY